jgi:hypothetical protein
MRVRGTEGAVGETSYGTEDQSENKVKHLGTLGGPTASKAARWLFILKVRLSLFERSSQ